MDEPDTLCGRRIVVRPYQMQDTPAILAGVSASRADLECRLRSEKSANLEAMQRAGKGPSLAVAAVGSLLLTCLAGCGTVVPAGQPARANRTGTTCTVPASPAVPSATTAAWTSSGDSLGSGSPFLLSLGGPQGGPVGVRAGQRVRLAIFVSHASPQPGGAQPNKDALSAPLPLRVCIYAARQEHVRSGARWVKEGSPLWSFTPPALAPARSSGANEIAFSWNTAGTKGTPLPPGVYLAQMAFPSAIQYTSGGQGHTETLPTKADTADQQYFTLPIFLGGPNPQPAMNPQVRALASTWDHTIYVPTALPGNPPLTVSSIAPPPGMPRALIGTVGFGATHPAPGLSRAVYQETEEIPLGAQPAQASGVPATAAKTQPHAKLIHVTVAGDASPAPAVVFGASGSYRVNFHMGKTSVQFQASGSSEAHMIAAARNWTPVAPVEPS